MDVLWQASYNKEQASTASCVGDRNDSIFCSQLVFVFAQTMKELSAVLMSLIDVGSIFGRP